MNKVSGVYAFGAIREKGPKQLGKVTLNGQENDVYTLHYGNIAMVVSRVTGEVLPNRDNLFAHQQTISSVMTQYTIVPMSFGNVFRAEEDVILVTKHMQEELEKLFLQLENKIEVGLKIIAKQDWIEEEMKKDPVLRKWKMDQKDLSDPALFYEQIQIGEHAQNFISHLQEQIKREIYDPLLELAKEGKQNQTIPGKILLNAAFLVDLANEEAFDQRVNELYERWQHKTEFKYTGPWPAYNFVHIVLRIEGK